ncbi:MAG: RecX family transcriptional regulator [Anaerolineae bacterium]|jgi:regulatory protein
MADNVQTVTALQAQKKNKERVNVFLDGSFAFGLPLETAVHLKVGQSLSQDEIAALQQEDLLDKVKQAAYRLISYRPRSIAEVKRHLGRKGYDEELIDTAVSHLTAVDLLNDEAFARYWVEQRDTFKPRSRLALNQELRQKGVPRHIIESVLTTVDEHEAARRAAAKKTRLWAELSAEEFRGKLGRFLQRRGFSYEIINQIINEQWQSIAQERTLDNEANHY